MTEQPHERMTWSDCIYKYTNCMQCQKYNDDNEETNKNQNQNEIKKGTCSDTLCCRLCCCPCLAWIVFCGSEIN